MKGDLKTLIIDSALVGLFVTVISVILMKWFGLDYSDYLTAFLATVGAVFVSNIIAGMITKK